MFSVYINTFTSIAIVSLVSFVGVFTLTFEQKKLKKITLMLVSLSAGTLLGDSFLHLMPEAVANNNSLKIWLWLLAGIITFFSLEKIIFWRHCHVPTSRDHPHPIGIMNLIGDGIHNFMDGAIIAGAFLINFQLGVATAIAVIVHEMPQEIGDFGILVHAGFSRVKTLFINFLISLFAFLGAGLVLILNQDFASALQFITPFTAGGFIYIAMADIIPELQKDSRSLVKSLKQLIIIIIGIGIMLVLKIFLG